MLSFFSVFLLTYGAMHLYAFGKAWQILPHSNSLALALLLAGIALTASPLLVHGIERLGWLRLTAAVGWVSYLWMAYLFLFFCIGLTLDLGRGLSALLHVAWPMQGAAAFVTTALLSLALTAYGHFEASHLRIERIDIATPKLATGKVTIAQISDLHLGLIRNERFLADVVAQLQALKPDIVVATGDIVDREGDNFVALARLFRGYRPPLGAYAVTGNHERYAGLNGSLRFIEDAGFRVLHDTSVRTGGIVLIGLDDPAAQGDIHAAAPPQTGADDYVVLLKHQPVVADAPRFDLQLSGHVHGGQIFPFGYLPRLVYGYDTGLTRLADGRRLYISRGTGTWGPPIRLFAPPEITLITLTNPAAESANMGTPNHEERP